MKKGTKENTVSFRLTDEQLESLQAKAMEHGCSVHEYARALVLVGIEKESRLEALIRRATWAAIVALSPEWDEAKTEAFLEEYLQ